jgi:hypothetical protein
VGKGNTHPPGPDRPGTRGEAAEAPALEQGNIAARDQREDAGPDNAAGPDSATEREGTAGKPGEPRATEPSPEEAGRPGGTGAAKLGARAPDDPDARRDGAVEGKQGPGRENAKEAGSARIGTRGEEAAAGGVGGRDAVKSRK